MVLFLTSRWDLAMRLRGIYRLNSRGLFVVTGFGYSRALPLSLRHLTNNWMFYKMLGTISGLWVLNFYLRNTYLHKHWNIRP